VKYEHGYSIRVVTPTAMVSYGRGCVIYVPIDLYCGDRELMIK